MTPISRSFVRIIAASAIFFFFWKGVEHTAPSFVVNVGYKDVLQYRSAASLFLKGLNPYDETLITDLQKKTWQGEPDSKPVNFYTLPMALSFVFPMALLPFTLSVHVWLSVMFALVLESFVLCYGLFETKRRQERTIKIVLAFFFLTFFPLYYSFYFGQLSPILLFGLVASLVCFKKEGWKVADSFLGGICLSVTSLKPHLLYLLYIYILVVSIREKEWKTLAGMVSGVGMLLFFPVIYNPKIIPYFFQTVESPPIHWLTPTLGTYLQGISRNYDAMLRFIPTVIVGSIATLFLLLTKRNLSTIATICFLLPLSLVTTPYCWVFDQMLLAPAIFFIFSKFRERISVWNWQQRSMAFLLVFSNLFGLLVPGEFNQQMFIWYPIFILGMIVGSSLQYKNPRLV